MNGGIEITGYNSDELPLWAIRSDNARRKERIRRRKNAAMEFDEWFTYLHADGGKRYYKVYQNLPGYLGISRPDFNESNSLVKRLPDQAKVKPGVYICCYCDVPLTLFNYTKEHLVPKSRRGKNSKDNLRPCCVACNNEKDNLMLHTYIQLLCLKWADSVTGSHEYNLLNTKINNANKLAKDLSKG